MTSFREIVNKHIGPPVDIEGIVRDVGVGLDKKASLDPEISGQLERVNGSEFKISVNRGHHYFRRRFTIAHELAHFLLHRDLIGAGVDDSKAYRSTPDGNFYNTEIGPREEAEANRFAARLLIPKSKLGELVRIGDDVAEIAKNFQVSPAAMKIRLGSLGYQEADGKITGLPD